LHRSLCICALVPRLETRTRVILLLHQLEAQKPTSTGALAARCLASSRVLYRGRSPGADRGDSGDVAAQIAEEAKGRRAFLLYPHPDAIPIDEIAIDGRSILLVVPDGTWRQVARARARLVRQLGIPSVRLDGRPLEGPRLRHPTAPDRMATLEAVAAALGILEGASDGPPVAEALLRVYRIMSERTLWTNGRIAREAVTGGIPPGVRSHDPLETDRGRPPGQP
jgi:DTW domain-containing protein YfiP